MSKEFTVPEFSEKPTPEERAEFVIQRLEQFIRDGRSLDEGMSFRKWQAMAKTEIVVAISEAENSQGQDEITSRRVLVVSSVAMITIGFWGAAISLSKVNYLAGGIVCLVAGLVMFSVVGSLRYRKWSNHRKSIERCLRLGRIGKLNSRIKRLEVQLDKEVKNLEKALKNKQRLREG